MSSFQNPPLILGSTSKYRRELLERLRIPFEVISPKVDETPLTGESTLDLAMRLARAKAAAVAKEHPDAWVIGSDQVADLCGAAIGDIIFTNIDSEAVIHIAQVTSDGLWIGAELGTQFNTPAVVE